MASTGLKTASTHRSVVLRGTHVFHIVGCSGIKRFASVSTSTSIKSGSFLAGGHPWALACSFDAQGHLASIALEFRGTAKDVVATAGIRIEDPLGEWPTAVWRNSDANRFQLARSWALSVPNAYHGHEACYVRDDRLTVECTVDVLQEYSPGDDAVGTRNCFVSVVPPPTIARDLYKLLLVDASEFGSGSDPEERRRRCMQPDVTFVVEETQIQAHKLVLAMRSPVFAAEFRWHTNPESGATGTWLSVKDISASTFRAMLRFIYTDELPIKPSDDTGAVRACKARYASRRREAMARDLLVAADRYDLERLRLMIQNILLQSIDASTVMGTLILVRDRHTCRQLEDSCIEYIASDPEVYAAVMATEEYQELKSSCSPLIIEIMERVATHNGARNKSLSDGITHWCPEKTSSTHNASVVHGVHEFKIPNFCAVQRSLDAEEIIHSGTFRVGDYDWRLEVHASGAEGADEGGISMYLRLLSPPPAHGVTVTQKYMLHDPSGKPPLNVMIKDGDPTTYTKENEALGYHWLITLTSAKSQYLASDGSLTIYADLAVAKQPYASTSIPTTRAKINVPLSNIALQLDQLLVSKQGADVRFLVEGSEILAHGLVIAARSPILYQAVAVAGDNKDGGVVSINGMKASVFKAVLHFVYTDDLAPLDSTVVAEDVLVAASRFGLDRMKIYCENILAEQISQYNAFDTLMLARRHHCSKLEDYCVDFILSVPLLAKDVMKTILFLAQQDVQLLDRRRKGRRRRGQHEDGGPACPVAKRRRQKVD